MTREELVEAMARAIFDAEYRDVDPLDRDIEWPIVKSTDYSRERGTVWHHQAAAALSVALDAILGPIEALHQSVTTRVYTERDCEDGMCEGHHDQIGGACYCPSYLLDVCRECRRCYCDEDEEEPYPCPTRRACDQIRAELGGGEQ